MRWNLSGSFTVLTISKSKERLGRGPRDALYPLILPLAGAAFSIGVVEGRPSRLTPIGANSQIAPSIRLFTSFSSGSVTLHAKVMSNFAATNANIAVERLRVIVYSMPSR
jgi:hypothetical protein